MWSGPAVRQLKAVPVVLFASTMFAAAATAQSDDAALARRLVGTWVTDPASESQGLSTATYNADGTGTESVRLRDQPESAAVRLTTRWSIKDGILTLKSLTSSDPQKVPVGLELKDRIISITAERFVFEAHAGYGKGNGKRDVKLRKRHD